MRGRSGELDEADSASSFGEQRRCTEEEGSPRGASSITQHTTPTRGRGDDSAGSSSDTANFLRNSQDEIEANLSFVHEPPAPTSPALWSQPHLHPLITQGDARTDESVEERLSWDSEITRRAAWAVDLIPDTHRYPAREDHSDYEDAPADDRSSFEVVLDEFLDDVVRLVGGEKSRLKQAKSEVRRRRGRWEEKWEEEVKKLRREKEEWKERVATANCGGTAACAGEVVELDVGGTHKLATTRRTLAKIAGSGLAAMFSGKHALRKLNGRVFIDRDGEAFCLMISYLRNSQLPAFASSIQENLFHEELDFWGIPPARSGSAVHKQMEFDPDWCATSLKLEKNLIVRKTGHNHGVAFCKYPLDEQREWVEFKVVMSFFVRGKSSLFVGMVDKSKYKREQLASTFWKDSPSSFYWDVSNRKLIKIDENGNQVGAAAGYGCACINAEESHLGMKYETSKKTIRFFKNGIDQGVAFTNVPAGLYPAVDLWFEAGAVEVTKERCAHQPENASSDSRSH